MADRTKLLIHLRRISGLLENAIASGPDGTLEGKYASEHPTFVHHAVAFYLIGVLAYLESEDGSYSWNQPSPTYADFDVFAASDPPPPEASFASKGITTASLDALAQIRNAVVHHDGDLALNRKSGALAMVQAAQLPGVVLSGSTVTLEAPLLEFTRQAGLAVRRYYGDG